VEVTSSQQGQPVPVAHRRSRRVAGALVGSVVGDALGAPFEFGPAGAFSARFPAPARGVATEMCGGGGWEPGEWTDDTQMALLVAESLIDRDGLDEEDMFARFVAWAEARPKDVGIQTSAVLGSGLPWQEAAARHFASGARAAGNGSLMRTTPAAIWFAAAGPEATMEAARRISALTHGDPAAGEGCALFHELLRVALNGDDPLTAVDEALAAVPAPHQAKWAAVLAPTWTPQQATEPNGAVWPTLGSAVWALRVSSSFEQAMRAVIDLGGDTDTVAAVTGGLAGAVYAITGIPMRWSSAVHGELPGFESPVRHLGDLLWLAARLSGNTKPPYEAEPSADLAPGEVTEGVWASDLDGARRSSHDFAVISLCRTGGRFGHPVQRFAHLVDDESNDDLEQVLDDVLEDIAALRADGRPVLVHCFGGASRTGLVLRAWLMRDQGLTAAQATALVTDRWPHLRQWNESFTQALAAREGSE
jgi:ADP-ribosyl-[dinitrogen reductase] hydrolase